MDNSYHGLAFLLSLGTLPIACTVEKGESDSDGTTTGGPTTDNTGSGTTGTTGGTTGGSDGMTTGGTTDTPTSGTSSPTTAGETETGGPTGACEKYVAHAVMCDPDVDPANELSECQGALDDQNAVYGPMCGMLFEEYLACLSESECDDEMACEAENMAVQYCSPEIGPACMAYGAKYAECYMVPVESSSKYCQIAINQGTVSYGPQCGAAYEEYFVCFSNLSCDELMMGNFCQAEQTGIEAACL
jgi:hypothetical protein